ncbi:hypothetical protein J6590_041369 [Homalodisca vitripennis]|nr:hypothetical protein J6590_041369 [Homalodisca vitripennis]
MRKRRHRCQVIKRFQSCIGIACHQSLCYTLGLLFGAAPKWTEPQGSHWRGDRRCLWAIVSTSPCVTMHCQPQALAALLCPLVLFKRN